MGNISKNFDWQEFVTDDGGNPLAKLDQRLIERLQFVRDHFNKKIKITSGFRTPEHNSEVGGSKNSQHLYGRAADFVVEDIEPVMVQEYCRNTFTTGGLGLGKTFTHLDVRWSDTLVVFDYA